MLINALTFFTKADICYGLTVPMGSLYIRIFTFIKKYVAGFCLSMYDLVSYSYAKDIAVQTGMNLDALLDV